MGCCCSKKGEEELHQVSKNARRDPSPPPPPPEEEMVKEVLSETPKPKPKPKSPAPPQPALHRPHHNESAKSNGYRPELAPALLPEPEKKKNLNSVPRHLDERSEQPQPSDEACSLRSEATSVATPTSISSSMSVAMMGMASAREREWGRDRDRDRDRDREETTTASSLPNNKLIHKTSNGNNGNGVSRRSSQLQSYSGELGGGGKKERSAPPVVSGVGCRSGRASPVPPPRNNSRSLSRDKSGIKRDLGERSARRSVSPGAKRRELAGPNKSGLPARRIPSAPQNKTAPGTGEAGEGGQEAGKESLDNPSVSLECFIFL